MLPHDQKELFHIDQQFLDRYRILLTTHSSSNDKNTPHALLESLKNSFGCRAVALVGVGSQDEPRILDCEPAEEIPLVAKIVRRNRGTDLFDAWRWMLRGGKHVREIT